MKRATLAVCLAVSPLCLLAERAGADADFSQREDVARFVSAMEARHGYDAGALQALFSDARSSRKIINAISKPAEALPWHKYRGIFLKPDRIRQGLQFWRENQTQLDRVAARYGVPPEVATAIIGVETKYGRNTGGFRVLDALATLAFDYPKRGRFFAKELEHYLLLTQEQSLDPRLPTGSYAGAMGIPQFIPSSYRAYAVDFDGDGLADIWENAADAIGSVGNYFKEHGWRQGGAVAVPATVADGDVSAALTPGLKLALTMADLAALGIAPEAGSAAPAASAKVKLLRLENKNGPEYWLAFHNFYVITRYNHSALYAMAVHQLAGAIKALHEAELAKSAGHGGD